MVGLDSYMLQMTVIDPSGQPELKPLIPISKEESRFVIEDLEPGKKFDIELFAVKKIEEVPVKSPEPQKTSLWTQPLVPVMVETSTGEFSAAIKIEPKSNDVDKYRFSLRQIAKESYAMDQSIEVLELTPEDLYQAGNEIVFSKETGTELDYNTEYEVEVVAIAGPKQSDPMMVRVKTRGLEAPIPKDVRVSEVGTEEILLSWTPDPAVETYEIKLAEKSGEVIFQKGDIPIDPLAPEMTYKVSESLKPGTKYDIIMLSKNKFDRISAPSEPVTASTEPESVHQIRQTQEFRDKIRFTFYPPKRGKAEEFEVKLFQPNEINPDEPILVDVQNIEFKEDATTYLVNFDKPNLKPGAQYEVQVVSKSLGKESVAVRQKVSTGMFYKTHSTRI